MSEHVAHENHGNRLYLVVWGGLLGLTILEVILAYQFLPVGVMLALLLSLSILKTGLIVAYFMHLRFEKLSLTLTLIPALVVCITLLFIFFPDSLRLLELRR
ncbi:cytochrome C oxidase subunit IV family protein [Acidobacteria bacterium AH-259-D05]|nr:cytochrome C oxidase subunit IV family protein [Acidobacteria bacterium AH-259-D05]